MAYCVMNVDKQGRAAIYGLQIEANREPEDDREFDRSDIDKSKTGENIFLRRTERWNEEITRQIKEAGVKERKDSVVAITGVYTASPEWFKSHSKDEWLEYFKNCLDFHDREYGRAFNAVIHLDETTPHMQVISVPIIADEKGIHLSAKIIMGNRDKYRRRQDLFYEQVGKKYGLERGEIGDPSIAKKHQDTMKHRSKELAAQISEQEKRIAENDRTIRSQDRRIDGITTAQIPEKKKMGGKVSMSEEASRVLRLKASAGDDIIRKKAELDFEKDQVECEKAALEEERKKLEEERAIVERENSQAEAKLIAMLAQGKRIYSGELYEEEKKKLDDLRSKLEAAEKEYQAAIKKRDAAKKEADSVSKEVSGLSDKIDDLKWDLEITEGNQKAADEELESTRKDISAANETLSGLKVEVQQYETLKKSFEDDTVLQKKKDDYDYWSGKAEEAQKLFESMMSDITEADSIHEKAVKSIEADRASEKAAMEKKVSAEKDLATAQASLSEAEGKLKAAQDAEKAAQDRVYKLYKNTLAIRWLWGSVYMEAADKAWHENEDLPIPVRKELARSAMVREWMDCYKVDGTTIAHMMDDDIGRSISREMRLIEGDQKDRERSR